MLESISFAAEMSDCQADVEARKSYRGYRFKPDERAVALAADALARARPPIVAIAPGARWATKRWPAERFARVAEALAAQGASIVLAGGPSDRDALAATRSALRAPVAADLSPLPIDGLAAALARVRLLVACDSGPVHLAAAVGTPALALFGPTSTVRWGPPPPGRALSLGLACSPCSNHGGDVCPQGHHRCLADLAAADGIPSLRAEADRLDEALAGHGLKTLVDDRPLSPGVRFADADLIGVPVRVTVGKRLESEGTVGVKLRAGGEEQAVPAAEAVARIVQLAAEA
jgi:hypothetical protein